MPDKRFTATDVTEHIIGHEVSAMVMGINRMRVWAQTKFLENGSTKTVFVVEKMGTDETEFFDDFILAIQHAEKVQP